MKDSLDETVVASGPLDGVDTTQIQMQNAQTERRNAAYDALVLDAKLRQSLVTIRSLGQRGRCVAALEVSNLVENSHSVPTFSSRWCQNSFIAPAYEQNTEQFLHYMRQFLRDTGARVLIPSADGTLALLREHREEIERLGTRLAIAKESALSIAISKDQTLEIARELGLGVPRGIVVNSVSEVAEAIRKIGLPAVVKPSESWVWGEDERPSARLISRLVTTADEARLAVEELSQFGPTLFQQFLSGRNEAISFIYANGEMYARFAQWAKRTQPPLGGTSVYRQSIALPDDISTQAERLIRAIDLEGYSEVEFRRDSAGKAYLMEINPRLSASVEVAVRAGVDFPYLLYQWANGDPIDYVKTYRIGGWMRYLEGDILTTIQALSQRGRPGVNSPARAIFDFFAAFFVPAYYDYFDKNDLKPAWTATTEFAERLRLRLGKSFTRRKPS
ncbi:MAG: ATP-grasp domain-containing protein [Chloroflexi bacterium]|nr:ATP-grasp domain-containing protein [Chloroflexota bacterium]